MMSCCNYKSPSELTFKQEFVDRINCYIDRDSTSHHSYLIIYTDKLYHERKITNGYLVGPLYYGLYTSLRKENFIKLFCYKKKIVYLYSVGAEFLKSSNATINFCEQDSCILYNNVYSKEPLINFLKRANLFYYKKDRMYVESEIDTLFMPKLSIDKPIMN